MKSIGRAAGRGRLRVAGLACVLAAVLATVLASCAAGASHAASAVRPPAPATQLRTFTPYDAHGRLTVRAGNVAAGNCFAASAAAPAANAYRCFSGDQILDPCVSPPAAGDTTPVQVACRSTPWSEVVVLHLHAALPAASPVSEHGRPWALELVNGVRCVASTGTVPLVADVALPYSCTNGAAVAIHDPNARIVTVDYGRPDGHTVRTYAVRTMWRS